MNLLRKCAAECAGVFAIVFGGCGAVAIDQISGGTITHVGIATAFGLIVMTMIYATGHISGAHLNPAVTLAFAATRHFPRRQIAPYIAAQCLGALLASGTHDLILRPILVRLHNSAVLNLGGDPTHRRSLAHRLHLGRAADLPPDVDHHGRGYRLPRRRSYGRFSHR